MSERADCADRLDRLGEVLRMVRVFDTLPLDVRVDLLQLVDAGDWGGVVRICEQPRVLMAIPRGPRLQVSRLIHGEDNENET